jgi:hypothetical protein
MIASCIGGVLSQDAADPYANMGYDSEADTSLGLTEKEASTEDERNAMVADRFQTIDTDSDGRLSYIEVTSSFVISFIRE